MSGPGSINTTPAASSLGGGAADEVDAILRTLDDDILARIEEPGPAPIVPSADASASPAPGGGASASPAPQGNQGEAADQARSATPLGFSGAPAATPPPHLLQGMGGMGAGGHQQRPQAGMTGVPPAGVPPGMVPVGFPPSAATMGAPGQHQPGAPMPQGMMAPYPPAAMYSAAMYSRMPLPYTSYMSVPQLATMRPHHLYNPAAAQYHAMMSAASSVAASPNLAGHHGMPMQPGASAVPSPMMNLVHGPGAGASGSSSPMVPGGSASPPGPLVRTPSLPPPSAHPAQKQLEVPDHQQSGAKSRSGSSPGSRAPSATPGPHSTGSPAPTDAGRAGAASSAGASRAPSEQVDQRQALVGTASLAGALSGSAAPPKVDVTACFGEMMSELSPPVRDEISSLWEQYRGKKSITSSVFLERAKALLGPEKFAQLAAIGQAQPPPPGTSAPPGQSTAALAAGKKKRGPPNNGPSGSSAAAASSAAGQGSAAKKARVSNSPHVPSSGPSIPRSTTPTGSMALASAATAVNLAQAHPYGPYSSAPASTAWMSGPYSATVAAAYRQMSEGAMMPTTSGAPTGYIPGAGMTTMPLPFGSGAAPTTIPAASKKPSDAASAARSEASGDKKHGADDSGEMGDSIRFLGVNIEQEEELLRSHKGISSGGPATVTASGAGGARGPPATMPEPFFISMPALRNRVARIAGAKGITHVTDSAIYYLGLALQDRLRDVLLQAMRVAELRSQTSLARDLAGYGVHVPRGIDLPTPLPSAARAAVAAAATGGGGHAIATPPHRLQYQLKLLDQPDAVLSLIQFRDVAAEVSAEEHAQARSALAAGAVGGASGSPSKARASSAGSAQAAASSTAAPTSGGGAAASSAAGTAAGNAAGAGAGSGPGAGGDGGGKKKRERGNLAEEARQRNANATAFFAAGGNTKSWMTMGATGADGGGGGGGAAGSGGGPPGTSAAAKRAALLNRKRAQQGARAAVVAGQAPGAGGAAGATGTRGGAVGSAVASVVVPGTGVSAHLKRLQPRDLLLALRGELATGAGKCNASGVGKVTAKVWVKLREK